MRLCSADVFSSTAGGRGGGTGAAALNGVLSCGSIDAQAASKSAVTAAAAIRAAKPRLKLVFDRLDPALVTKSPMRRRLSRCRGCRLRVFFLSGHLDVVRVRELDLRPEARIEKSAHANRPAGQTRQGRISRVERFAVTG